MNRLFSVFFRYVGLITDLFRISLLFRVLVFSQLALLVLLAIGFTVGGSQKLQYTFADKTVCTQSFVLLPHIQHIATSGYAVEVKNMTTVHGYPLVAKTVCVTPRVAPGQNSTSTVSLHLIPYVPIAKSFVIHAGAYPNVQKSLASLSVISVNDPLVLPLSSPDNTFKYLLRANDKTTQCQLINQKNISCDTAKLNLKHATNYEFTLLRTFESVTIATLSTAKVETVTPIKVTTTSISPEGFVYDKPHQVTVQFDKSITSASSVTLKDDADAVVDSQSTVTGNGVVVSFSSELVRGKRYTLTIGSVRSSDGGSLIAPYVLAFTPAKGPKVTGVNIGTSGIPLNKTVVISFDQAIQAQDIKKHITLSAGDFDETVEGSALRITPRQSFAKCSTFRLSIDSGIASPYGISGESTWSYNSRATCFEVLSIGKSVQGRSILAYRIGNGSSAVLFVGGMHGNEPGGQRIMNDWLAELDANPDKVPVNRTIVVIPATNPDGLARNQRVNVNGIDLNRNFPANSWKADVKEPNGAVLKNGGGVTALDQPEASALAAYTQQLHPNMVMSYHCCGGVAVANDAGNSRANADMYSAKTGYNSKNGDTIGNFFDYDTTGAYEDWLHDKLNTPLILVELWSNTSNEFSRSKNGLWFIAQGSNF